MTETMTTSSTGGMKGTKLARHDLIPAEGLTALAEHFGRTCNKYPPNNWRVGFEWSKSYAALIRHAVAWWSGEDVDPDPTWGNDPASHLAAVAWHAMVLLTFVETHPEFDDRYKPKHRQNPAEVKLHFGNAELTGYISAVDDFVAEVMDDIQHHHNK